MVFTFGIGEKHQKKNKFAAHENYMKFKFQCSQIKFYWNTAISLHLYIAFCSFHTESAELSS